MAANPPATGRADSRPVVPLAALAAGAAVALVLGVFGVGHQPTAEGTLTLGLGSVFAMKVTLASLVGILAIAQLIGGLWLYGKLGIAAPRWLGTAHRLSGALALLASVPVAYNCLWGLGFQAGESVSLRVALHSIVGCVVYGAVVVKVTAVRARGAPGWFLPVAGGLLFALLITVVGTSAVWYVAEFGWPTGSGASPY